MEWFVEKAVEIGIDEISFIACEYSERRMIKTDRMMKIAESAMKQSLKTHLPVVNEMIPFDKFIESQIYGPKCIAHCRNDEKAFLKDIITDGANKMTILIGPEGDFSLNEITSALKQGYSPVSFGNSRLRTETAALVACTITASLLS